MTQFNDALSDLKQAILSELGSSPARSFATGVLWSLFGGKVEW
jgi:hypothetical protein